ncbi:MAG: hypothetical protein SGI88_09105 [Candidatus Hydrogenedentes bacterium]|nr:hypothetical protein [Candidatus Hydrogenedentota bacterium]
MIIKAQYFITTFALLAFMGYATIQWNAALFGREYKWGPADIATWYGFTVMIFGAAGITYGGVLSDWLSRKGYRDGKILCEIISATLSLPLGLMMLTRDTGYWAMVMVRKYARTGGRFLPVDREYYFYRSRSVYRGRIERQRV